MSDYNKYVEAVNKIYEIVAKMRVNYIDQDNIALLDQIEENKQVVIDSAKLFKAAQQATPAVPQATPQQQTESSEG